MAIKEVNRSEEGSGGDGRGYEPFHRKKPPQVEAVYRRRLTDTAQVTRPDLAAMQLLRERVVQNARLALHVTHMPPLFQSPLLPDPNNAQAWADRLLKDLNLLFSLGRAHLSEDEVKGLLETAFKKGSQETFEILSDLGACQNGDVWQKVAEATAALAEKLVFHFRI